MKLLFLANRVPYPPYRGDKLKIYNLAKQLSQRHELHLLTFSQSKEEEGYREPLLKYFKTVRFVPLPKWKSAAGALRAPLSGAPVQVLYFRNAAMHTAVAETLATTPFDAVHVQHLRMAQYLADNTSLPRILDLPDAFSLYWERRKAAAKNAALKRFAAMETRRLLRYEPILKKFELSLACSVEDINWLSQKHSADNLRLLQNGVDLDAFAPGDHQEQVRPTLLFTGNMDYAPNVDAVVHFTTDILPKIRATHPDVRFIIGGQRPVAAVQALAQNDAVEITGFVPDMAALYRQATVVVAPLRFGAGTQNKVLEAMAMGIPVVSTAVGFAGLGIRSGEGVFCEPQDDAFAARVSALLSDEQLREKTGRMGLARARSTFGWEAIAEKLEGYFEEAVRSHALRVTR